MIRIFDSTVCTLGEGPLWHPTRLCLFWFDILSNRLYLSEKDKTQHWEFHENVSAAGWINESELLLASETSLNVFNTTTGGITHLHPLELKNKYTRSNDGRADPWGGFWISTMGKTAKTNAGAIYRYYKGELRKLRSNITIPNAICFSPTGSLAYFSDTSSQVIYKWRLSEKDGWPLGESEIFVDLRSKNLNPDGAVVDLQGNVWNAVWGAGQVICYSPNGDYKTHIDFGTQQVTCPAFGGNGFSNLFVTSAAIRMNDLDAGKTFLATDIGFIGQEEHQVIL